MTLKTCIDCGEVCDGPRCPEHTRDTKANTTARGYGWSWQKVTARARKAQPFCSVPGCTSTDLTTDHSEAAWQRHNAGKAIRLQDVDVLCRRHNAQKGAAR